MSTRGDGDAGLGDIEQTERWLFLDAAPPLTGETAAVAMELLGALIDAIDGEYEAEIRGYRNRWRRRSQWPAVDPEAPWRRIAEQQLSLDLGDDDFF